MRHLLSYLLPEITVRLQAEQTFEHCIRFQLEQTFLEKFYCEEST